MTNWRYKIGINLMKIISHELMNSLTPIRALSQNLLQIVDQEKLEEDDFEEDDNAEDVDFEEEEDGLEEE